MGLASGGSALAFALSHRDLGRPPAQQHTAIDPFQTQAENYDSIGLDLLDEAGVGGYVRLVERPSALALPALIEAGHQVDLAYVDGSHLFEDVFVDFYFLHRMLAPSGVVCFDDCALADVRKVLRFVRRNYRGHLEEIDVGPFRADGGGGLAYRAASVAGRRQLRAFRKVGPSSRPFKAPLRAF